MAWLVKAMSFVDLKLQQIPFRDNAQTILSRRFGECKDHVTLLVA
jgi:transglutaminase-like putative cysteine protease